MRKLRPRNPVFRFSQFRKPYLRRSFAREFLLFKRKITPSSYIPFLTCSACSPRQSLFWLGSELTRSRGWKFTFNSRRIRGRYAMTDRIPDDKFEATPLAEGGPEGLAGTKRVACSGQRARFNIVYKLFHGDSHQHTNWFGEDLAFPSIPIDHRSFSTISKWKVTEQEMNFDVLRINT